MSGRRSVFSKHLLIAVLAIVVLASPAVAGAGPGYLSEHPKLDRQLAMLARYGGGEVRVIIELQDGVRSLAGTRGLDAVLGRRLRSFNGTVAKLPARRLAALARHPLVKRVYLDRPTGGYLNRTAVVVGARAVQHLMGLNGAGVGVAVIDSGITTWHDDLMGSGGINNQQVVKFVDFVNNQSAPYDDNGHGTHVSGVIAGDGYDSYGQRAGIAPGAHLIGLKVLDGRGAGYISDVIAALDWAVANKAAYNIRVINLSVGAAVTESYWTDPLTLAAKSAADAGIVVVVAAGNLGKNAAGHIQYGAITAPGNAPWVLTVGAYSHMGTTTRVDDMMASYSSRGPTFIDFNAKPDLVAPGTGIVSLSDATSTFYTSKASYLLWGRRQTSYKPYLSLSGTSMAAPVVTGTVALMLQANPALTPNAVKAILQYTSQVYPAYDYLTQGAGFLNTRGAVQLARFYRTAAPGARFPKSRAWSRHIIWGTHRIDGGVIMPSANAWALNVVWGSARDADGDNIVWGSACPADSDCENIVWGNDADSGENIVWGNEDPIDNIVWGNSADDNIVWGSSDDNIVWGTTIDPATDNIVWGNSGDDDNIVWGNDCDGADCENIVWGSSVDGGDDNIVWGNSEAADNIVWGTGGDVDNIVWGTSTEEDNATWGNSGTEGVVFAEASESEEAALAADPALFDALFEPSAAVAAPPEAAPAPESTESVTTPVETTEPTTSEEAATATTEPAPSEPISEPAASEPTAEPEPATTSSSMTMTHTEADGTVVTTTTDETTTTATVTTDDAVTNTSTTTLTTTIVATAPDGTLTTTSSTTTFSSTGGF